MLPQFEISSFSSQIFWLLICFGAFFCFVQFYFFPKMYKMLLKRNEKIKNDIRYHEQNLHQIQKISLHHENLIKDAKLEADTKLKEFAEKTKEFAEKRCHEIDEILNAKFNAAKKEIEVEVANFQASIEEDILKSVSTILLAIEGVEVPISEVKKYVA